MMLTKIFCVVDDFCKELETEMIKKSLYNKPVSNLGRKRMLCKSEIMTIIIYFSHSNMKTFKSYYDTMIRGYLRNAFGRLVSYNRFLELMKSCLLELHLFLQIIGLQKSTGINFIDSFSYKVCHIKRASSNRVFRGIAKKGKTSMGWFFGFKVHAVINHFGEIINFCISPGNCSDINRDVIDKITKNIYGKLFGDKGYLSNPLFERLYKKGIQLFTKIRKNMENKLLELENKILLKKRGLIESVFNKLKSNFSIEHSRHRSFSNFITHVLGSVCAYYFEPKKPSIVKNNSFKLMGS